MRAYDFIKCIRLAVMPFLKKFTDGYRILMDNCPTHTAKISQAFLKSKKLNLFDMPAQSPDLHAIEMVWNDLKYYLCTEIKPTTLNQLTDGIKDFWKEHSRDLDYCNKKINHVTVKVIDRVILLRGQATGL